MRSVVIALASVLMLAACAEQPTAVSMAPPGQDAAGKQFLPPPAGYAALYFYNATPVGPGLRVVVNGREIGVLGTGTWMRAEFTGGPHNIRCTGGNSTNFIQVELAPGQMRFFNYQMMPGQPVCSVREVGPDEGRNGVLSGYRAYQGQ